MDAILAGMNLPEEVGPEPSEEPVAEPVEASEPEETPETLEAPEPVEEPSNQLSFLEDEAILPRPRRRRGRPRKTPRPGS